MIILCDDIQYPLDTLPICSLHLYFPSILIRSYGLILVVFYWQQCALRILTLKYHMSSCMLNYINYKRLFVSLFLYLGFEFHGGEGLTR